MGQQQWRREASATRTWVGQLGGMGLAKVPVPSWGPLPLLLPQACTPTSPEPLQPQLEHHSSHCLLTREPRGHVLHVGFHTPWRLPLWACVPVGRSGAALVRSPPGTWQCGPCWESEGMPLPHPSLLAAPGKSRIHFFRLSWGHGNSHRGVLCAVLSSASMLRIHWLPWYTQQPAPSSPSQKAPQGCPLFL